MKTKQGNPALVGSGLASAVAGTATPAPDTRLNEALLKIKSPDDSERAAGCHDAAAFVALAVKPLAELMEDSRTETALAAKRALWKMVRRAGRPGNDEGQKKVGGALVSALGFGTVAGRREILWMLSEIGTDEAVPSVAAFLSSLELRDDARGALQRIPGARSLAALKSALGTANAEFRPAIAVSLRARGERITEYPSEKLAPNKQTRIKPVTTG